MTCVYKITRSDGLEYIGITSNLKKRMYVHNKSKRFEIGIDKVEVLFESNYRTCEDAEEIYIKIFDTFKNGLNVTEHGKGKHYDSSKFNTLGYRFSDKSRKIMSEKAKGRTAWNKGKKNFFNPSDEWIEKHTFKGSENSNAKLSETDVREIIKDFLSDLTLPNVGIIQRNGKPMSYKWAFCLEKSSQYQVTPQLLRRILDKKAWKHVWKEYEIQDKNP